ncbi:guanylate kinase [Candidatus Palauibacter sp.]|uniref:guanylate kinase n=1 Tax=Candidatus Palauibacter sp. TaxID=3101350 RepID=UPI003B5C8245
MSARAPAPPPPAPFPVILAGPSGAGKTTLRDRLLADPGTAKYLFSVSMTTRSPRTGEVDEVDYRFVSRDEFDAIVARGAMLEYATVHGERYGTPRDTLKRARKAGAHLLLDIDVQGTRQVRDAVPEAVSIFIVPPTAERIVRQLRGRGSETPTQLERRLAGARSELEAAGEFDYLVVNDRLGEAAAAVSSIVTGSGGMARRLGAAEREYVERIIGELDRVRRMW